MSGDKSLYEKVIDPTLLDGGFAVVAPDYTLSTPGHPGWPNDLHELDHAVYWVRHSAAKFDLDPGEVAAMGESAGGHLALMLGTDPSIRLKAVVDFYGPTDLSALYHESHDGAFAAGQLLGGTPTELPARYADASPVHHVSAHTPPVLIVQGDADQVVPPGQSDELAKKLTADGVPHQLVTVAGAPHGFGLEVNGTDLGPTVLSFLRQNLSGNPQRLSR
jgi:acetyl esterase/lipase